MRSHVIAVIQTLHLWSIVACGGERVGQPDITPDTSDPAQGVLVTGTFSIAPALVVYREATETDWKTVTMTTPTSFQFHARGPYLVTVVCEPLQRLAWVHQIAQTPDDRRDLAVRCDRSDGPHRVTGSILQAGKISMGGSIKPVGSVFEFKLRAGTFDVIANAAGRIAIRRGIPVSGDTTITNPIDVTLEGATLISTSFSASNATPTEQLALSSMILSTPNGAMVLHYDNQDLTIPVPVAPNSVLMPSDIQLAELVMRDGRGARGVRRRFREGDSTVFTLPDYLGGVTFSQSGDNLTATWASLPEHSLIRGEVNGTAAGSSTEVRSVRAYIEVSRSFETALGMSSVTLDTAIPGYRPEWRIDTSKKYHHSFSSELDAGNDTSISTSFIAVNSPAMSVGSPGDHPHDLRRLARPLRAP